MKRPILVYGDPILEQVCAEVIDFSPEDERVIADLIDTCRAADNCAGLAAPQIGVLKRIAVVRTTFDWNDADSYLVLINPRILSQNGRSEAQEGCLSIPGHRDKITRPDVVVVQYQDESSEVKTIKGTGLFARALVHEIDHLDGRLFIHYFGNAYCAAVKEWLGRQSSPQPVEEPIEQTIPAVSSDPAPDVPQSQEDSTEVSALPEASFVQAERPEDDVTDGGAVDKSSWKPWKHGNQTTEHET